jgi:hypothetical protein
MTDRKGGAENRHRSDTAARVAELGAEVALLRQALRLAGFEAGCAVGLDTDGSAAERAARRTDSAAASAAGTGGATGIASPHVREPAAIRAYLLRAGADLVASGVALLEGEPHWRGLFETMQ